MPPKRSIILKDILIYGEKEVRHGDFIKILGQNFNLVFCKTVSEIASAVFDVIMVFEKGNLASACNFAVKKNIPILFVSRTSLLEGQFSMDFFYIGQLVLIKDSVLDQVRINEFTTALDAPCVLADYIPYKKPISNQLCVLFHIENIFQQFDPLYNIIDLINPLSKFNVTVLTKMPITAGLFNDGIQICQLEEQEDFIAKADIVVGSGQTIRKAIAMGKPAIVLGVKGYGGFVDKENIEHLFESQFQGRSGGTINERIPSVLFFDDFFMITKKAEKDMEDILSFNRAYLEKKNQDFMVAIGRIIEDAIDAQRKIDTLNEYTSISRSSIFDINPVGNGSYVIVNKVSKQFHSVIKQDEYVILEKFQDGELLGKVARDCEYDRDMKMFKDFIRELIYEKILIIG